MKIALLTDVVETSKKKIDSIKKSAKVTIESTDKNVRATAGLIKKELTEALANYESKVAEYKAASIDPGKGQGEEKFNVATDFSLDTVEFDEIMELKFKLSALTNKSLSESDRESSTGFDANQSISQSNNQSTDKFVKFKKIFPPKFSGQIQERFQHHCCS